MKVGRLKRRGNVAVLWIDNPPVNAISAAVRAALVDLVADVQRDAAIEAAVVACAGRTFMAGADIAEFGRPPAPPTLPEVTRALESSAKPLVAAIHGSALGGGFEIALACHYRIAAPDAQVGLPEVKLGLLPGSGGTQRLPRAVGVEKALDMILSGEPLGAPAACAAGAVDRIAQGDLIEDAVAFARERVAAGKSHPRLRDRSVDAAQASDEFFSRARERVAREKRHLVAPQRIVDAVEAAVRLPFDTGLARERELFLSCLESRQSRALRHVFFAEREAAKLPGGADAKPRDVRAVAVIGAGTMGGGIAMSFANAGIPVTVLEADADALERGLGIVRRNYEASVAKGRLTAAELGERMARIRSTLSYDDLREADLLIEAVFETLAIKREVFARLDAVAKPGAIVATNTSYLSIDAIAEATSRPRDVVGMHFFSPANVMRLLEIVRGAETAPEVLLSALHVARRIRKVGVVAGNCFGFIGNRMLAAYAQQAQLLALEGAAPAEVDRALVEFGMPMGPFQVADLAGLDVGYRSRKDRDPESFDQRAARVPDRLVEMGRLGQKTQGGFYDYVAGDRTPRPSARVSELIEEVARELRIERRAVDSREIAERCLLPLVNVGCEILEEGIAWRAGDIDVVYINGYGFPAWRGGPMFWAEHEVGLDACLRKIRAISAHVGERWVKPAALLGRLVAERGSLYEPAQPPERFAS